MKRPQIVRFAAFVTVLAVLLGYVVYHRSAPAPTSSNTASNSSAVSTVTASASTTASQQAGKSVSSQENYFANYRMQRDQVMSQEIATLQKLIKEPSVSSASRAEATKTLVADTQEMKQEMEIEKLLSARGFPLSAATVTQKSVEVVVAAANKLSNQQVAQIADAATQVTGLSPEDVVILPKK